MTTIEAIYNLIDMLRYPVAAVTIAWLARDAALKIWGTR
jgi:hypothetical protein